jgi:alpha-glucosidase
MFEKIWKLKRKKFATMAPILSWFALAAVAVSANTIDLRAPSTDPLASCPGYKASNVKTTASSLTANLKLAGPACNVYGTDLTDLTLAVTYETGAQTFS